MDLRVIGVLAVFCLLPLTSNAQCRRGQRDVRLASSCANAIGPDLHWEAADHAFAPVTADQCTSFSIVSVREEDNVAQLDCVTASGVQQRMAVNLAYLSCRDQPLLGSPRAAPTDCPMPPPVTPFTASLLAVRADVQAVNVSEAAQGVIRNAREIAERVQAQIVSDSEKLIREVLNQGADRLPDRLAGGLRELEQLSQASMRRFGNDCEGNGPAGMSAVARIQGQRTCVLLQESLSWGRRLDARARETQGRWAAAHPAATAEATQEIYAKILYDHVDQYRSYPDRADEPEFLAVRMLMFQSLPAEVQNRLATGEADQRLGFVRQGTEGVASADAARILGANRRFYELHTGYVFGGSRLGARSGGGLDCSDFIAQMIRGDVQGGAAPSTLDFMRIAQTLESGRNVSGRWRDLASCFEPILIREGDEPQAGDVVIMRNQTLLGGSGHIVLATDYDRMTGNVSTLEAAGGVRRRNTVNEFSRPLFEPSCGGATVRAVRPDLYVLRFKGQPPASCPVQ